MGWFSSLFSVPEPYEAPQFELDIPSGLIPSFIPGYALDDGLTNQPLDRSTCLQVPAVLKARNVICSTLGGIPMKALKADNTPSDSGTWLSQPEVNVPRSVTMTKTYEDMLFEGIAWWRITKRGSDNFPSQVERLDPLTVSVKENGEIWVGGVRVDARSMIQFLSPNPALRYAAARAIRQTVLLDQAAAMYSAEPMPIGYFTPREGADPADDDDVVAMLDTWKASRKTRGTAYVPASLEYKTVQFSAKDLQLAEARQHAVLEIARATGLDPEELGVSVTSRTYQNAESRRKDLIDFTLGHYARAVEDRLSLGDVTPRGHFVTADFSEFLRSDIKTRYDSYTAGLAGGWLTRDEIREAENLPAITASEAAPTPTGDAVNASFADTQEVTTFESVDPGPSFSADLDARTITGRAVVYSGHAVSNGRKFAFSKGSLKFDDPSRVKLLIQHNRAQAVGKAISLDDREDGLYATFKVARGTKGDEALIMAADGVWDGLSIGTRNGAWDTRGDVQHAVSVPLAEISLTPDPAFSDARVHSVTASADDEKEIPMPEVTVPVEANFSAITDAITKGFANLSAQPEVITPVAPPVFIAEPATYAFEAGSFHKGGKHDFSGDLLSASKGDQDAKERVLQFMTEQLASDGETFATISSDVSSLNPSRQRPDLYVDRREYDYPLWHAVQKETIGDVTPIVLPKYNTSSGLVSALTENVEPAVGAFTTTSQTITPSPVGGKVEISRVLFDQGGNPRVSGLIWNKMVKGWFEALEAKVVAALEAASPGIVTITTAQADKLLSKEIAAAFSDLQFVRGGFTFDVLAAQIDLYKKLAVAVTDTGEPLFPMIAPNNRNGIATAAYSRMNVHGVDVFPEWALAATGSVAANSYLFDKSSIYGAASAPNQIEWNFGATVQTANLPQLSAVTLGIWGYSAVAIMDIAGVRRFVYDPV